MERRSQTSLSISANASTCKGRKGSDTGLQHRETRFAIDSEREFVCNLLENRPRPRMPERHFSILLRFPVRTRLRICL